MTSPDHGVIALDVTSPDLDLSALLRGTASRFNPHITLMPRFPITSLETTVAEWTPILKDLKKLKARVFQVSGPKWPETDLCWYEFDTDAEGRTALQLAHEAVLSQALSSGVIREPPHFSGKAFHPHMTVAWRTEAPTGLPPTLTLQASTVALYTYGADPHAGTVKRAGL